MSEQKPDKKKGINWTAEKTMSASALFVSVISVVALLYQLSLSREENELIRKQQSASVRPHLTFDFMNKLTEYRVILTNKGVGPAFVKEVEYSVNDSLKFNRSDFFYNHIKGLILEEEGVSISVSTYSFMKGVVLTADSELNLFSVFGQEDISLFRKYLRATEWNYKIVYEDIYGERWMLTQGDGFPVPVLEDK